jgi:micrococcal nuclease
VTVYTTRSASPRAVANPLGRRGSLIRKLILTACVTAAPVMAAATDFNGRVVGVHDGDTISVMHDGHAERVRLEGIDCPEDGQPFGKAAKRAASDLVFGRDVRVQVAGKDRYGRTLGRVYIGQTAVSLRIVRLELAWPEVAGTRS